jgi:hypothetical protein
MFVADSTAPHAHQSHVASARFEGEADIQSGKRPVIDNAGDAQDGPEAKQ